MAACTVGAADGRAASPLLSEALACATSAALAPRAWPACGAGEGASRRRREGSANACEGCTRGRGLWSHALWCAVQAARAGAVSRARLRSLQPRRRARLRTSARLVSAPVLGSEKIVIFRSPPRRAVLRMCQ